MTSTKEFLEAEQHFLTGENFYLHHLLGCQFADGSYTFRVWAPNAQQVWLQGRFHADEQERFWYLGDFCRPRY